MALQFDYVSLPALFIGFIVNMFIGMMWYSPLFGKAFIRLAHHGKMPKKGCNTAMIAATISSVVSMSFFAYLLSALRVSTPGQGALWGFSIGFFFDSGLNLAHPFFEERPLPLFVMHRGYHIVSLTVVGALLSQLCGKAV